MVRRLLFVWLIGVVAFFVLWAILAKVIQRISERKRNSEPESTDSEPLPKD